MEIKKSTFWAGMIILVLVLSGFVLTSSGGFSGDDAFVSRKISVVSGDVQVVKFYVEGSTYVFEPSTVKKGIPVRLEGDMSRMPGCSRSVISSELGIRKVFRQGDNTVEFTPEKAGAFYVACSMNMYKGSLTVLESDGSENDYVQKAPAGGGSCGGCGGF